MSNLPFVNTLREVPSAYGVFSMAEKNGPTTHNIKLDADKFKQETRPVFLTNIRMKYKNMLALAHFLNPQIKIRCLTG